MSSTLRSRHQQPTLSTKQCRSIIERSVFAEEQLKDHEQQYWLQRFSQFIEEDHKKQRVIKQKLINQFFSTHKKKGSKDAFRKQLKFNRKADTPVKIEVESRIRDSLSLVFKQRDRTPKTPIFSKRYDNMMSLTISECRPLTSPFTARSEKQTKSRDFYSSQIDSIIEQSNKIKKYKSVSTPKVKYPRSREKELLVRDKREKYKIMDKVIQNDIEDYIRSYSIDLREINPEEEKQRYEERKRQELTNLQKYNMSFIKFMKQKTNSNIERAVYHQKIRQKNSYVEKFQKQLLDQSKLSDENRSRLERVFQNIEQEYKGHSKTRASSSQMSR